MLGGRRYKKHAGLDCYPPLQIMFAAKTTNRGKLDSHCWFFDGFAYLLQPDYCVLFDAGGCWWAGGPAVGAVVCGAAGVGVGGASRHRYLCSQGPCIGVFQMCF